MSWIRMVVSGKQEKQGPKSLLDIGNLQTTPLFNNPITCSRRKSKRETVQVSLSMEQVILPARQALTVLKASVLVIYYELNFL